MVPFPKHLQKLEESAVLFCLWRYGWELMDKDTPYRRVPKTASESSDGVVAFRGRGGHALHAQHQIHTLLSQ